MKLRLSPQTAPVLATLLVCVLLYVAAGLRYEGFFSLRVLVNFIGDNAFLGIVAIGLTFVILSGGIDLSVGAVVGCTSISVAMLIQELGVHPAVAFGIVLTGGTLLGISHGLLIQKFGLPPFLVTLAGLFFARGLGLWISDQSIQIAHPFIATLNDLRLPVSARITLSFASQLFLVLLIAAAFAGKYSRFGRTTYAIGGNEQSALLMGLAVNRTKIGIYALSGFCAALGGVAFTLYTSSGNAICGTGLELDAIAAVVIGGTMLTGGYGSVFGSLLGLLILAIIQTAITFDGTLSSWWSKIVTGALLLAFILMQRAIQRKAD